MILLDTGQLSVFMDERDTARGLNQSAEHECPRLAEGD